MKIINIKNIITNKDNKGNAKTALPCIINENNEYINIQRLIDEGILKDDFWNKYKGERPYYVALIICEYLHKAFNISIPKEKKAAIEKAKATFKAKERAKIKKEIDIVKMGKTAYLEKVAEKAGKYWDKLNKKHGKRVLAEKKVEAVKKTAFGKRSLAK